MKILGLLLLAMLGLRMDQVSYGQGRTWEIGLAGGAVYNIPTHLAIRQGEYPGIYLAARYRTEPFSPPVYYDTRISTWQNKKGWSLKFTHHKLILSDLPAGVQRFSITDGFNLLTANRLWEVSGFTWSVGAGIVITHPESTIRHQAFPENRGIFNKGYYLSGPTVEAAVARRYFWHERWFVIGEGRVTGSYARVPVANGRATVTNAALHALIGLGFQVKNPKQD